MIPAPKSNRVRRPVTDDVRGEEAMRRHRFDASPHRHLHDHADVPVQVDARSYRQFTRWLDRELDRLVARWAHRAVPNATRDPHFRFRFPAVKIE